MTPLRQRFIDDLRLRNYAARTIESYVGAVARFAKHFGHSPEVLGSDEIRAYQLHLLEKRISWSQFNQIVSALRLLYRISLSRPDVVVKLAYGKRPRRLPSVLSPDEVAQLLAAASPGRERVLLQTAYACGLRLHELVTMAVEAIDSARMLILVHGKGQKDRLVPMSALLLRELRSYWRSHRSARWLFPGHTPAGHLSDGGVQRIFHRVATRAQLGKQASMHTLRHSYATHLLEAGVDVVTVQKLLGHRDLHTTTVYLHLSSQQLRKTPSLLDLLVLPKAAPEGQP